MTKPIDGSKKLARAALANISDEELLDMRIAYAQELNRCVSISQALRGNIEHVKSELKRRREGGFVDGIPYVISDHAIVRYLERHKDIDIPAIREELRQIAARAKFERTEKRLTDRIRDPETGIVFIYSRTGHAIATILPPDGEKTNGAEGPVD